MVDKKELEYIIKNIQLNNSEDVIFVYLTDWLDEELKKVIKEGIEDFCKKRNVKYYILDPENNQVEELFKKYDMTLPKMVPCLHYFKNRSSAMSMQFISGLNKYTDYNILS